MQTFRPEASIIIPARNATGTLGVVLGSIIKFSLHKRAEIIIVVDGVDPPTAALAKCYPVKVIIGNGKGPGAARNIGIMHSSGKILIFLDADCVVSDQWYSAHLRAHESLSGSGLYAVGGSFCSKSTKNSSIWATCDHYCSWYNVNPACKRGWVPNHPPANLSISREMFDLVGPFQENLPPKGVHEEARWQGKLLRENGLILFEPQASVWHIDRGNFGAYLKHNYWWAFNSIVVKSKTGISRFPFIYKSQWILAIYFLPFSIAHTLFTIWRWFCAGDPMPILLSPLIYIGRLSYALGMVSGKLSWAASGFRSRYNRKKKNGGGRVGLNSVNCLNPCNRSLKSIISRVS